MRKITLLLLMMLSVFYGSAQCNPGESQLFITTSDGSYPSEQWVSVTSEPDGAGTVIYAQGDGTYGNGSGDLTNEPFCVTDGETYYINAYDSFADSWNGGVYTITDASGTVIANNSGVSPDDGTDEDASGAFGNTQEQELEVSEAFSYTPPACAAPANALISDVTPYTAVFSWDEEPAATLGYDWRIMNEGEDPDDANNTPVAEGTTMTSSDTSVNITGLSDSVTYDAYVASNCDTNGFSDYSGVVSFSTPFDNGCGAYTSSPNLTIDDDNDPEDIIVVSGTGPQVLSDLNVALKIDHTWLSDLDITLTSPSGNSIEIISDLCGLNDNFDIVLDDEGEDFACGTPTVGVFIPEGLLSGFDGEVFDGDWTLSIIDDGGGDDGILIEWCLIPTLVDPPACEAPENLITDNIDAVSANLSWDEVAAANSGYEWVVMTDGEDPADSANTPVATGTTAASTEVTATATGLAPETDYDVYVRSNCG
ncbi:proprotein convertase P-domain-containing protein, partial [Croceibacter atlanticus]